MDYRNQDYRARWWTEERSLTPNDFWEMMFLSTAEGNRGVQAESERIIATYKEIPEKDFKVVGYFSCWKADSADLIRYDILTHIIYAFAIPTPYGGLKPLSNPDLARKIVQDAHRNGKKALLAVGGWSDHDMRLEPIFVSATATEERRKRFADEIVALCNAYGFDGVDMDWEYPRPHTSAGIQYQDLMLYLAQQLHQQGKLLTTAVIAGVTVEGDIFQDAAAQSDAVLNAVDWIHIMAYDGGEGPFHSPYDFAVMAAEYWKDIRHLPAEKIVLGIPFYARPTWTPYRKIVEIDPSAAERDTIQLHGEMVWYNGIHTVQEKTRYAYRHLGGVMIWELSQDSSIEELSLLSAIAEAIEEEQEENS